MAVNATEGLSSKPRRKEPDSRASGYVRWIHRRGSKDIFQFKHEINKKMRVSILFFGPFPGKGTGSFKYFNPSVHPEDVVFP